MSLQTLTSGDTEGIYDALCADGAVVVHDLFPAAMTDRISTDIHTALDAVPWCNTAQEGYGADFFGRRTKRLHGVLQYSRDIEDCLMHPIPFGLAQRWLGYKPHFSNAEVMAIGPGEKRQDLHLDAGSWRRAKLPGEILFSMTLALTDFTAENGATVLAPGSHKWPAERAHTPADFVAAEMTKGSALLYPGNLLHGGGANRTDTTRVGLYFGYIPFWLQALENSVTMHPAECLDRLKPATQAFIDYHPHGFLAVLG